MKKAFSVVLIVLAVIFLAVLAARLLTGEDNWICKDGEWVKHGNPSAPKPTGTCKEWSLFGGKKEEVKKASLPNPASQNCIDKGGKLVSAQETAGVLGICLFDDGTQCEEWQFFRSECQKGQSKIADTNHPYSGFINKTGSIYTFKSDSGVVYSLKLPANAAKELKDRLNREVGSQEAVVVVAAETPPLSKTLVLKGFQEK